MKAMHFTRFQFRALCGAQASAVYLTTHKDQVTCKRCNGSIAADERFADQVAAAKQRSSVRSSE